MYIIQNLFTGERKVLEHLITKFKEVFPPISGQRTYSEIITQNTPHFYINEVCGKINPKKWVELTRDYYVSYAWSAEDIDNSVFLRTESECDSLLPKCFAEVVFVNGNSNTYRVSDSEKALNAISADTGINFKSVEEAREYTDSEIEGIYIFDYQLCDLFGNVLPRGTIVNLMYEYINIDNFIKWLNFKLRNDGLYEANEKNVFPFLQDLEFQLHSKASTNCIFVLPPFSTRSGNYEVYKFQLRCIDGKDCIIL